ncbi:PREDICTED: solute carrier organic anion transporter family member 2B1-like [Cyprinodon variegatus]|uniref:solute carrier organic anion transporter family member 2B1-like n=1 Tax=Cyprinodon variegatus TaxID=28743 RepID=UPI00074274B8|nr:PREDICTED: solute carrier organic anion transporter family member 2B1-like [Cyprinodon variegatus]
MVAKSINMNSGGVRRWSPFSSIKVFVFCHSFLQLAQLLVSGFMKSSISTIERRYGLSSQKSGILASFNEVGNTVLIIFVSFLGSRVHRPRFIGGGALLACLASLLMALPHFLSDEYIYTDRISTSTDNSSGLCGTSSSSNQTCLEQDSPAQQMVYPLLLLGQLLLGIGAVPIQPFGISYIDDYASRKNSPLYLGILLAVTSIGPAFGFITGSFILKLYVDFDKLSKDDIELDPKDLRWVGAWWLNFLLASGLLFLSALPYLFFPREMPKENAADDVESRPDSKQPERTDPMRELSFIQFLKCFPRIALRTLRSPIYLLVVLGLVNLAALVCGLGTFMGKFIEKQFSQTTSFSNMMIGGIGMPLAVLGIVLGGVLMRRFNLSVNSASKLCSAVIFLCVFFALPMIFIGCPTQTIAGSFPVRSSNHACNSACNCPQEAFNPVCGSDGVEFRSPCHAGCLSRQMDTNGKPTNFTNCTCINEGLGGARQGTCGSGCSHLLLPFMVLLSLTCFIISFAQTPSYMMILRTVPPEDKSFAVGVQYMLFRVLAFLPGPVLYGSVIDTTCILWGQKCGKNTSCLYYNLDKFRQRYHHKRTQAYQINCPINGPLIPAGFWCRSGLLP